MRHVDAHGLTSHDHFQRFRHFMSPLLHATGGTLANLRVLDMGCNAGFWAIQCALAGAAEVVGFDARSHAIEQANLLRDIAGLDQLRFEVLRLDEASPQRLGGTFDVVLNLGLLYHLPDPLDVLQRTFALAGRFVVLDTDVDPDRHARIALKWEEASNGR